MARAGFPCRLVPALFVLVLTAAPVAGQELAQVPPKSSRTFTVTAEPSDRVLLVEGRFAGAREAGPVRAVRLVLNGRVLDRPALGAAAMVPIHYRYSTAAPYGPFPPAPRHSARDRAYAFLEDCDFVAGNGPYAEAPDADYPVIGCPPVLQVEVRGLIHAGDNEVVVVNGAGKPFVIRRLALAPAPEKVEEPLPPDPAWPALYYSRELRARYARMLSNLDPADRGHVLAALGIAEYLRPGGNRRQAVAWLGRALTEGAQGELASQAAYRLAAERWRTGRWPRGTEKLVRQAATGDDPWQGLTRALLAVLDGHPGRAPRPVIYPLAVSMPPQVDGLLTEPWWQVAPCYPVDTPMAGSESMPRYPTTVRFAAAPGGLAFGFAGTLPADVHWVTGLRRDEWAWLDHCMEVFLATPELNDYREFNATPLGAQFDTRNHWLRIMDFSWDGKWQVGARLGERAFTMEYFIPWADLGLAGRPPAGTPLVISVVRNVQDGVGDTRTRYLAALTRYAYPEPHRLQEGAVLVVPPCPRSAR